MTRAHLSALLLTWIFVSPAGAQQEAQPEEETRPKTELGRADTSGGSSGQRPAGIVDEGDRDSFNINLSPESGGGTVSGSAGEIRFEPDRFVLLERGVIIKYRDLEVQADRIRVDLPTSQLTAEGSVILDEGPQRLTGEVLEYDLDSRTGRITEAIAYVDPDYRFSGSEIAKTGPKTFTITDGTFTACEQEVPSWSFDLSRAHVTMEEYARIRNARLKFKKLPVLYWPYIVWPATTNRASGWLIPKPGYSNRRGAELGLAYYRTLGRSADATFFLDLTSKEYNGAGFELRYTPSETTSGHVEAYFLAEPNAADLNLDETDPLLIDIIDPDRIYGDDRWKFVYQHESKNIWEHWRGVVNLQLYSDFDYLKDIERGVARQTTPFIYSNAYLSTNIGPHSINLMVDQREVITSLPTLDNLRSIPASSTRRQLPELEYRLRSQQLGKAPIYFSLRSSMSYFSVDFEPGRLPVATNPADAIDPANVPAAASFEYGRINFAPEFSIPLSRLPWLNVTATLGGRVTHYTDSLEDPLDPDDDLSTDPLPGGSLTRSVAIGEIEVVGPRFSRIYESPGGKYSKFKHVIEPSYTYSWVPEYDDQERVFNFDEVDPLRPLNAGVLGLTNRLLAKPTDEDEGAFEIASFGIAKSYLFDDFDEDPTNDSDNRDGPIFAQLRVNPSRETTTKLDMRYDSFNSQLVSLALTGATRFAGRHKVGVTWRTQWAAVTGKESSDQLQLHTRFEFIPDRLIFTSQTTFDLLDDLPAERPAILNQRYVIDWRSQCYDWQLEFRETHYNLIEDREIRFTLNLRNVGSFLDLNESL